MIEVTEGAAVKHLHYSHCLVGIAIAAALAVALGASASTLGVLVVALACPLMMLVMMRAMVGAHTSAGRDEAPRRMDARSGRIQT
jgi:hypothetical protein